MGRGRQPQPCPDYEALRAAHAIDPRPTVVSYRLGCSIGQARRWLGEIGIQCKPSNKQRPRDVFRYLKVAVISRTGRRYWVKLYGVWNAMKGRCNSPGTKDYIRYGARGIRVCDEWRNYGKFRKWALANGFRKGLTLDRENSNGNYEPSNCRWIPKGDQQLNTRRTHQLTVGGVTKPLPTWAKLYGLDPHLIRARLRQRWNHEHAVTIPLGGRRPAAFRQRPGRKSRIESAFSENAAP